MGFLTWLIGSMAVMIAVIRSLFIVRLRIQSNHVEQLLTTVTSTFVIDGEIGRPRNMRALMWVGFPVYLMIEERVLHAGQDSTDAVAVVLVPRPWACRLRDDQLRRSAGGTRWNVHAKRPHRVGDDRQRPRYDRRSPQGKTRPISTRRRVCSTGIRGRGAPMC